MERNIQHPQSDEFPLVSFTVENGVTPKTERYEREQLVRGDRKTKKYKETRLDDIVYNPANLKFGAIARNKYGNAVFSPIYVTYEVDEKMAFPAFVEMFVTRESFIQNALQYQQGTVYERMSVNTDDFATLDIALPLKSEQLKIGEYFTNLDTIITLHHRKPRDVCESRSLAWEQRKFEDMIEVCSGRDYKHLEEGDIPVYGTGGYMLSVSEALSDEQDAIGIGRKGTIDKPFILKAPFWTVDTLFYCVPRNDYDLYFVFDIFQNINWKVMDESTGVPSLSKAVINKVETLAPAYEEQKKIGDYFSELDHIITLHQRQQKCGKNSIHYALL